MFLDLTKPVYIAGHCNPLQYVGYSITDSGTKFAIFAWASPKSEFVSYIEYNCKLHKAIWLGSKSNAHLTNFATESEANKPKTTTAPRIAPDTRITTYARPRRLNTPGYFYRPFFPKEAKELIGARLSEHGTGRYFYLNGVTAHSLIVGTFPSAQTGATYTPQEALSRFDFKDTPFGVLVDNLGS